MKRFFYHDPLEGDYFLFETKEERDKEVSKCILMCKDLDFGVWDLEVEQIYVGEITGKAEAFDVVWPDGKLDDENCDESGRQWDAEESFTCNYKINPLQQAGKTIESKHKNMGFPVLTSMEARDGPERNTEYTEHQEPPKPFTGLSNDHQRENAARVWAAMSHPHKG